ncbi:MAG: alanine--tRNA ligase-related protein, partial [Patescibacteria group bacterium]|nr:alanine--tRNA ligase-related protein [Patescibacteria group bacterium]
VENPEEKGMSQGRIFLYKWENWWSRAGEPKNMPIGEPGGPDSEVFYDFGATDEGQSIHQNSIFADKPCHLNCDCGRFLEIGNSVFMQFRNTKNGFLPLEQKNIDFGGGLIRILAAANNQIDIFKTDLFLPLINQLETLSQTKYQGENLANFRVIADHVRAAVMLIDDGVRPDSKEQGYMVRRLLRRSIRYGKLLGIKDPFVAELVGVVAQVYADAYPHLLDKQKEISEIVAQEEKKFEKTINRGLREFDQATAKQESLTGRLAFRLYETHGFPLEMSVEEAKRRDLRVEDSLENNFQQAKKEHREQSRAGAEKKFSGGLANKTEQVTKYHTVTHLLLAALRQVLGEHVHQMGSNITGERLRFDFSHLAALTSEEKQQVEELANFWIEGKYLVKKEVMSRDQALKSGASTIPGVAYPEQVSVYIIFSEEDDQIISREFCGGPHVNSTQELLPVKIFKEKSAAAGVRRIYVKEADKS